MGDVIKLGAQYRYVTGRKVRQLRNEGLVPVVVYGRTQEAVNLQVAARELNRVLHEGGSSQLVEVDVDTGDVLNILIRDIQRHPVSHRFMHADFYAVDMTEMQDVSIPVIQVGRVSNLDIGLMVYQALDSVEVRALPADIPASVEVDVSGLTMDEPITISDLPALPGVEYLGEPDENVFAIITTRVEEEVEEAEEAVVEEGEIEPEVLAKGKQEEEDEEAMAEAEEEE